jgi:glucosylglycerol 3-phosphatase
MNALSQQQFSLDHAAFTDLLSETPNLLIVQDLDGVCMGLVKDPLNRVIEPEYIEATTAFDGHFFVLTNGEHIGKRGINGIIERAVGNADVAAKQGLYLPGLAAGGVQWQNRQGQVDHPGVSQAELAFLSQVPQHIEARLRAFFTQHPILPAEVLEPCIQASVLDNIASPTANLNTFYEILGGNAALFVDLQQTMQRLMEQLLQAAAYEGMAASFFVHYAPNLGRADTGTEIVWFADNQTSGTTDFQFMLRGAIKEAGVLALLNHYYYRRTGHYPLGDAFNARQAPSETEDLLALIDQAFDPALMPTLVGVGDTVTSQALETETGLTFKRGGSDRNFLHLIQTIGQTFDNGHVVVYIDSSGGELKNRRAIQVQGDTVLEGPTDPRDTDDPLTLNVVFPGGHREYCATFQSAAQRRRQ